VEGETTTTSPKEGGMGVFVYTIGTRAVKQKNEKRKKGKGKKRKKKTANTRENKSDLDRHEIIR